jgi:hypothetical protein
VRRGAKVVLPPAGEIRITGHWAEQLVGDARSGPRHEPMKGEPGLPTPLLLQIGTGLDFGPRDVQQVAELEEPWAVDICLQAGLTEDEVRRQFYVMH